MFHLNINQLSFHFDELESLISKSKNDFQIIDISETRLRKTQETTTNIQLENFNIEHVPTESARCIYRHPCMQQSEFNDGYLKPHSKKINQ